MGEKKLKPEEKAAILILAMGEEAAVPILRAMPPPEVVKTLKTLESLGRIDQNTAKAVVEEFRGQISRKTPEMRGNPEVVRRLFQKVLPKQSYEDQGELLDHTETELRALLESLDPTILADYLSREAPPQIAVTLAYMDSSNAARCLKILPTALRVPTLRHMATMGPVTETALMELTNSLRELSGRRAKNPRSILGGESKVAALLNAMEPALGKELLQNLKSVDPSLGEAIQKVLFQFHDLAQLPDRSLVEVLKKVHPETLKMALKGAPDNVLQAFLRNMSERAQGMFRDDLLAMGPVKKTEVEKAQQKVAEIAGKLIEDGLIIGPSNAHEYV